MRQIIRTDTESCFLVGQICILTAKLSQREIWTPLLHHLNPDFYVSCMKCSTAVTDLDMLKTAIIDVITIVTRAK
jgi:hypothetical protein